MFIIISVFSLLWISHGLAALFPVGLHRRLPHPGLTGGFCRMQTVFFYFILRQKIYVDIFLWHCKEYFLHIFCTAVALILFYIFNQTSVFGFSPRTSVASYLV